MQRSAVRAGAIEAIERATVAAVAPSASEDFDGWLLAFDSGATGFERGMPKIFLQVEDNNAAALSLYRRAGFDTLWGYTYWRRP